MNKAGREIYTDIEDSIQKEWLITNGIGGFASSTVACVNTRRYHGLLIASLRPPVERLALVSRIEETLCVDGAEYVLSTQLINDKISNPQGILYLECFERSPLPTWYYRIRDVMIVKTVSMVYGENKTLVTYKVLSNGKNITLKLKPFFLFRDFHGNMIENPGIENSYSSVKNGIVIQPFANVPKLHVSWDRGQFVPGSGWNKSVFLLKEDERKLPAYEDEFYCGSLNVEADSGIIPILFSDSPVESFNAVSLRKREEQRIENISESLNSDDELLKSLLVAADQFVVYRESTKNKTILAGYPWFSDWGRDTLISLTGLTLVPGRFEDAASILKTFASYIHHGLVPNCFSDVGEEASYNSVDASLWFFDAIYRFASYTNDFDFIHDNLYDGMSEIIDAFINGTDNNIKMCKDDYLISAGTSDMQLTWMDVRVNGISVTPRNGKAVEINALWYNALRIYAYFQEKFEGNSREITAIAQKVKENFKKTFWNNKDKCLYDYIRPDGKPDLSCRPNQIYAVYLPFSLLEPEEERAVVNKVFEELYTPVGLRSLSPKDSKYKGIYEGDRFHRDCRYHQGTAWGFLLGPFITSYLKVDNNSVEAQLRASLMIEPMARHLYNEVCLGSISEIFDGDAPYFAKGCIAQAWSVAEFLRCYVEDIKGTKPAALV